MTAPMIAQFDGLNLSIIDHHGKKWLTAEQVGLALGYTPDKARQGINNLYKRHEDEFTDQDTGVIKLMTAGGNQDQRIFSATGCNLLSFFSNTPRAKEFRTWAKQVLAEKLESAPALSNRPGKKVLVTRRLERQVLEMFVAGHGQRHIARETGLSGATVNLLLHAKYQFSSAAGCPECSPDLVTAVAQRHLYLERDRLVESQQRLAQRLRHSSHNQELAQQLDVVGQQLEQWPVLMLEDAGGAQ